MSLLLNRLCVVGLLLGWLAGCAHPAGEPRGLGAGLKGTWPTANGEREVAIRAEGRWVELGFQPAAEAGEVRINQHILRIEPAYLVLNGRTVAAVPRTARQFTVTLVDGVLEVSADEAVIYWRKPTR